MRRIFLALFLAPFFLLLHAQESSFDSNYYRPKKLNYKYVGIQANLLLQQFISFNSNSSINSNPYIFSYTNSNIKTGTGFAFGTGFNVSQNSSNDGVSSVDVQNANITFRFGFEKKYLQNERFIPFWGIDFGFGGTYNKVSSRLNQSFTGNAVVVETTKLFVGPAFRGGLLVTLSKHILLGTEFFFNTQVAYSTVNGGGNFGSGFVPFNMGFQAPTALFLIFRY